MAGILDSKTRVMDTLITVTGRNQASRGDLDVKFASITDRQINYVTGSGGILEDLSVKLYFEAASDDNDTIVFENDANGNLQPFVSDDYTIYGGLAFDVTASQSTKSVGGSHGAVTFEKGSIEIVTENVMSSSMNNFKRLMVVGSRNLSKYDNSEQFSISKKSTDFYITNDSPIKTNPSEGAIKSVDQIESVFQDHKLGNLLNYRFLPPNTKPYTGALTGSTLANYNQINQKSIDTYEKLQSYLEDKPYEEFIFTKTSLSNNILAQIYSTDITTNSIDKLAIIDAGEFDVDTGPNPHLLFAGKLYRDSVGALTFVNIFTIVME